MDFHERRLEAFLMARRKHLFLYRKLAITLSSFSFFIQPFPIVLWSGGGSSGGTQELMETDNSEKNISFFSSDIQGKKYKSQL